MFAALPAAAETTVKVQGDDVTITVPIDCAGCAGKTGPGGVPLADYWKQTAEGMWNAAFAKFPYCSKYLFHLTIDIAAKQANFEGRKGRHLVQVAGPAGNNLAGVGWEGEQEHNPAGLPGQTHPDGTRFFDSDHDGALPQDATPTVITHEVGHALGLGDDRDKSGNVLPGRSGTIMEGGANGVTSDTPLSIDKALVDRIGEELEKVEGKVQCKKQLYNGTLHATRSYATSTESWDGTATLTVEPSGKVSGTFDATGTLTATALGFTVTQPDAASWMLSGERKGHDFVIKTVSLIRPGYFDEVLPNTPFTIPATSRGRISTDLSPAQPGGALRIELDCHECRS